MTGLYPIERGGAYLQPIVLQGGNRRYPEIEYLRGFSIFTVTLMHLLQVFAAGGEIPQWLRTAASLGGTGGHMFFFCSGLGLCLSYLRNPQGFGEFIRRRFLKIYIPYIIIVFISWCLQFKGLWSRQTRALLSHIFLYKMFIEKYECSFGLHFWFISTIIQFYLLFIPLCRLRKKVSIKTMLIASVLISAAWWAVTGATGLSRKRIWGSFCLQYLWEFVLGMATAETLSNREEIRIPGWLLPVTAILGLGLQALMAMHGGWMKSFNDIPGFFGYGALAFLLYRGGRTVIRPAFRKLNTISYEFFLVHVLCMDAAYRTLRPVLGNEFLLAVLAMAFSIATAWVYSRLLKLILKDL